jgi:hypothetical protein
VAKESLRNELADTVTALLLSCELTLCAPNLDVDAGTKPGQFTIWRRQLREKLDVPA